MHAPAPLTQKSVSSSQSGAADTSLHGRWLVVARILWLTMVSLALILFVISIPSYFAYLHGLSSQPVSDAGVQLSLKDLQTLQAAGLSIDFYAWYNVILNILFVLGFVLVGLLIFWRKSNDRVALLASFALVMFSVNDMIVMLQTLPSSWGFIVQIINFLGSVSIYLFFYLFPSGHFDRSWIGWLTASMLLFEIADVFFYSPSSPSFLAWLYGALFLIFTAAIPVVQIYRYRRISTAVEREQTKWVVFGGGVGLIGVLVGILVVFVLLNQVLHAGMLPFMLGYTIVDIFLLFIPLFIAIAILRSRLWDIDILINRALVYGTLSISLVLLYAASIIGLQFLLSGFTAGNNLAIVASTLVIAALFQPLRRRIQQSIDRRFYRRKYNATRIVAAFGATLRNEVDLTQLRDHLLDVVQETMQPAHISLWLRETSHERHPNTKL